MPTIREAMAYGRGNLPPTENRILLQKIMGVDRSFLVAHDERELSPAEWDEFQKKVVRVAAGEPLPYVIQEALFFGRTFLVSPAVLIPRPETELLVETALTHLQGKTNPVVIDVGTGSGCIALTIGCEMAQRRQVGRITGVDISTDALTVARENGRCLAPFYQGVEVEFIKSDLLTGVKGLCDLVAANLPYIKDDEWGSVADSVKKYEPSLALRGGVDGLDLITRMLDQARTSMKSGGVILLEIGWKQRQAAEAAVRSQFPTAGVACLKDYAGHDRIIEVKLQ